MKENIKDLSLLLQRAGSRKICFHWSLQGEKERHKKIGQDFLSAFVKNALERRSFTQEEKSFGAQVQLKLRNSCERNLSLIKSEFHVQDGVPLGPSAVQGFVPLFVSLYKKKKDLKWQILRLYQTLDGKRKKGQ